ncbi:alpha-keto acid decarboxylase family protein [Acinetobacter variabilis]|uniref:alpha-keto acid decarboxylase family protein n=1 Tax=Acinetobacter variabilis TaxID=70346 RepID=UPI0028A77039|nr:thiamine pyrophosphate-binding protein [Acinetobacter variabilis]
MFMEIGQYLNQRLQELGIQYIFGVPGDFNLSYLEQIEIDPKLEFIGNCNELNAAYAADGYARLHGVGALLTTYGVGDLSAINGIAGAYAEQVAMVHISGIPPLHAVEQGALLHHTLIDGDYDNIMNCMREFTVAQTRLTPANAVSEIDRVLKQCILMRRPVHIQLPSDITHLQIKVPKQPLDLSRPQSDPKLLQETAARIAKRIKQARQPVLLIDNEAEIFLLTDMLQNWAERMQIPYTCLSTAKNIMNESHPLYAGVYAGAASAASTCQLVEQSDCLIAIGPRFTDVATAFFSHHVSVQNMLYLADSCLCLDGQMISGLDLAQLIQAISKQTLDDQPRTFNPAPKPSLQTQQIEENTALSQTALWQQISEFLQEDDVIVAEVGTANAGLSGLTLAVTAKYLVQPIWGSIGYTLPALLGSMLAAPQRRHLLFIGDGSIQLTIQELSTLLREGLKPVIFILNNGGYTIERLIMGENAKYNDIQNWQYSQFAQVFSADTPHQAHIVKTPAELKRTLAQVHHAEELCLIELQLPRMDAPQLLKQFAEVVARYDYGEYGYKQLVEQNTPPYKKAI